MLTKLSQVVFILVSSIVINTTTLAQGKLAVRDQHMLYSDILGQDRQILVGLPSGYTENKKYPVLYLLDGEHYFLMAHGVIDFLHNRAEEIPEVILVAIPNIYRGTDLTPVNSSDDPNSQAMEDTGGADNFLNFIKQELRPFIIENYSTSGNNILFGHSAAGLFATYSFLEEPGLFTHYITSDPSLWYGDGMLINMLTANKASYFGLEKTIFMTQIDRSQDEEDIMSKPQNDFMKQLQSLKGIKTMKRLIEGENHSTVPLKSLYQGLSFIFQNDQLEE